VAPFLLSLSTLSNDLKGLKEQAVFHVDGKDTHQEGQNQPTSFKGVQHEGSRVHIFVRLPMHLLGRPGVC